MRPLCQTLSIAFEISKNTPRTSYPWSKDWKISCVTDKNGLTQESPCLKPDWIEDVKSFSIKMSTFPCI